MMLTQQWILYALCTSFLCIITTICSQELQIHRFKRVCYLSQESFSRHNPAGRFDVSKIADISAHLCTHIIYTFCKLDVANLTVITANPSAAGSREEIPVSSIFAALNNLKRSNPSLKILISLGGPNQAAEDFEKLARSDADLAVFSKHLIDFIRKHKLNGVEVDWQYPGDISSKDIPTEGMNLLSEIVQHFRKKFVLDGKSRDRPRLLLAVAVGVSGKHLDNSYNFQMLNSLADFLTVRACDYHGSWDMKTGMNSPLFPSNTQDKLNVASSVSHVLELGARADKVVVTMCAKGSSFTLVSDLDTDIDSETSGPGIQGPFVQKLGTMAYFEVCVVLRENGNRMWHSIQKCPYLVRDRLWIGYDDPQSIEEKANWIVQNKLGGAALWSLDLDDFTGLFCKVGSFPLATAMGKSLKEADAEFFQDAFEPTPALVPNYTSQSEEEINDITADLQEEEEEIYDGNFRGNAVEKKYILDEESFDEQGNILNTTSTSAAASQSNETALVGVNEDSMSGAPSDVNMSAALVVVIVCLLHLR